MIYFNKKEIRKVQCISELTIFREFWYSALIKGLKLSKLECIFCFKSLKELRNCILCVSRVWSLFCSIWVYLGLPFLPIHLGN